MYMYTYKIYLSQILLLFCFRDHKYLVFFDITTCVTKGADFTQFVSVSSCPTPQVLQPVDHLFLFCL